MQEPNAEACCRACRAWHGGASIQPHPTPQHPHCNVFNYCSTPGGCNFSTPEGLGVALPQGGCELRFQARRTLGPVDCRWTGWGQAALARHRCCCCCFQLSKALSRLA